MRAAFQSYLAERYTKDCEGRFAPSVLAEDSLAKSKFFETISFVAVDGRKVVGYIKVTADRSGLGSLQVIGVDLRQLYPVFFQPSQSYDTRVRNCRSDRNYEDQFFADGQSSQ